MEKWLTYFPSKTNFMVETKRIKIVPLKIDQLELYLQSNGKFEREFNLAGTHRIISSEIRERVEKNIIPQIMRVPGDNYLFYTFWIVIDKSKKQIVAELGFKGEPNENGEIEIGYGTMHEHRGKQYMTEAVGAMVNWAKQQSQIKYILAETHEDNLASIKVLQKNSFQFIHQKDQMKWWKISAIK
jgi:ribosomal-protein-alanine N-acetyltransferase